MKELTNREAEILSLIARGYSNKLIGIELGDKTANGEESYN